MVTLSQYLADIHARGLRICEHPDYGGVNPALHMAGSYHVKRNAAGKGRAADINFGPAGAPPEEKAVLLWAARLADAAGLNVIYAYHRTHPNPKTNANHRDHLHVDDGPIAAYKAPGRDDALYARILAERPTSAPAPAPVHDVQEDDMQTIIRHPSGAAFVIAGGKAIGLTTDKDVTALQKAGVGVADVSADLYARIAAQLGGVKL